MSSNLAFHTAQLATCCPAGGQSEVPVLGSTVRSVMTMAAAHGMHSIALPLIGSGLAGWPAKLAAQIHVEQVVQFFKASTAACSLKVPHKSCACVLIFSSGSCCLTAQKTCSISFLSLSTRWKCLFVMLLVLKCVHWVCFMLWPWSAVHCFTHHLALDQACEALSQSQNPHP